jgi:uncharacterized membrane protein
MPSSPLHPALVHLPLGLAFAAPPLTLGLALALWRGLLPRRAWSLAVALLAFLLAGGIAAQRAGEEDRREVEKVISEELVDAHEERAEAFLWGAGVVLAASAVVLFVPAGAVAPAAAVVAAGTLVLAGLGYLAGKAGGELVYRHGAAAAYAPGGAAPLPPAARRERNHD